MEVKAASRFARISPRKTRLVVDLIRGKQASSSLQFLKIMNKKAAGVVAKTLKSAIANAQQKEADVDNLWVKTAMVDGGPIYKRYLARAMGRATMIKRPTSHITLVLSDERAGRKPQAVVGQKTETKRRLFKRKTKGQAPKGKTETKRKHTAKKDKGKAKK